MFLNSFIVVIVLLNVLIAVVSESYRVANERGNLIFLRSRFELVVDLSSVKLLGKIAVGSNDVN